MENRQYGTNPMAECRRDSHETIDKNKRYRQIRAILKRHKKGLTAKEVAVYMFRKGLTDSEDRNYASPRITELVEKGEIEPIGKTTCKWTGKTVTVFALREV